MKAAVIRGAHDLGVIEMPDPAPGPGEVVLSVDFVGICGSDLSYYSKGAIGAFQIRQPLVPGHEIVGRVVRDDRPYRLKPGTPVTIHPASPGSCLPGLEARPNIWPGSRYLGSAMTMPHQQGGMSTLLAVGADHLRVLPESLPLLPFFRKTRVRAKRYRRRV